MSNPVLSLQMGSLYASGSTSTFTGTGGPFGYSPYTSQFGGVVTSAGLAGEPFSDKVYNVAAGDEVTFVLAVQNLSASTVSGVTLAAPVPTGFTTPPEGLGVTVIDGTGTDLPFSGDPTAGSGLTIAASLAPYDPNTGLNLVLVTYTLQATQALPGPNTDIPLAASVTSYATTYGGQNLANANPVTSGTDVVSAAPTQTVTPETDPSAVAKGQVVAFDVTLALPAGTAPNLRLAPILTAGASTLDLVSTSIVSIGSGLTLATPTIASDGSIAFGTVTASASATAGADTIVARIVVRADGTTSGNATLHTILSTTDPNGAGGTWSADVASSVGVIVPPPPPTITGLVANQPLIAGTAYHPFSAIVLKPSGTATSGTVAVTLATPGLGTLATTGPGTLDATAATFTLTGTFAALQAAIRQLSFSGAAVGSEAFAITLIDSVGGIAQTSAASAAITRPATTDPLFDSAYYLAHNPDVAASGVDPYTHFLLNGWKEGRNPDAFFDVGYYLRTNPDVAASGVDPLLQFETTGWQQGRDPSLAFSTRAYLQANPDVAAANIDPLAHYLAFGVHEGRAASPANFDGNLGAADILVDAASYDRQLGASILPANTAQAQAQAAESYHATGWQLGLNPGPWFDARYYLAHNPDVAAAGIDPLAHFEQFGWKEGRDPSLGFSVSQYLATYGDVRAANVDPLLHYIQFGQAEGRMAFLPGGSEPVNPLVDTTYYDSQLPVTLIPTGTAADQQAVWSYDIFGWQQGLNPDAFFNTNYYLAQNPDVAAAHIDPLLHYEAFGWKEGRNPSAAFSTNKYLAAYADVKAAGIDPLIHFLVFGQAEGRQAFAV